MEQASKTVVPQAFFKVYVPTRMERFWRWAGYRFHLGQDDETYPPPVWSGWMKSETDFRFTFADRLRLLLSGRLTVAHVVETDTPSPMKTFTRVDWQIKAPGQS